MYVFLVGMCTIEDEKLNVIASSFARKLVGNYIQQNVVLGSYP